MLINYNDKQLKPLKQQDLIHIRADQMAFHFSTEKHPST
jgi:hypothetical protein